MNGLTMALTQAENITAEIPDFSIHQTLSIPVVHEEKVEVPDVMNQKLEETTR
jgi:hypothetical protein